MAQWLLPRITTANRTPTTWTASDIFYDTDLNKIYVGDGTTAGGVEVGGGGGTVTNVAASGSADITVGGSPITTTGTLTFALANTAISPGTYTSVTVDAKGRVTAGTSPSVGTVTSVGISTSGGISVSGSPITTSGSISLGLGAITPTSVASSGTVTGTNLSGTNTGDQTITLTGNVTGTGTGSFAATIANDAVTFAKMLNATAQSVIVGRGAGAGGGDFQEITLGPNLSMTGTVLDASGLSDGDKGDITVSDSGTVLTLDPEIKYGVPIALQQGAYLF